MLKRSLAFGFKNFQNHMGINNRVTLGGLVRRGARKYPKTYNFIKKGTIVCGLYFLMISLFPGTTLPLQKQAKLSILSFNHIGYQMWYYSLLSNEPEDYLIKLNEIVLSALNQQIHDVGFMSKYFKEIQQVIKEQKRRLKQTAYLDLLLYTGIILQHILRYQKKVMLDKQIYNHCEWVFKTSIETIKQATQKENRHVRLFYALVLYLLNFAQQGQQKKVIQQFHHFCTKKNALKESSFALIIVKGGLEQPQFISQLKSLYAGTSDEELRVQIMDIFEAMDSVFTLNTVAS